MSKNKSITKNYLYNISYKILTLITPLITTPYVSRTLGVDNIGIYNYTYSIVSYFVLFGVLGLAMYGQREIAYVQDDKYKSNKIFWELQILRLITVGVSCIIFACFIQSSFYKSYLLIFLFELLANLVDISWFYYGIEEFKIITIRNIVIKIIGILTIFIFVHNSNDLSIYIWCNVLVLLFGNLSLWLNIDKYICKPVFSIKKALVHIKPVMIMFLPQCVDSVYMVLDKIMIGKFSTVTQVGLYSQADKIIKIAVTVITSMGLVMSPRIAASFSLGNNKAIREYLEKSFKFVFLLAFPIMIGISCIANNFVTWFFGPGFDDVGILMKTLCPTILFLGLNSVIGWQYLLSIKREKEFIISVSAGAIINVILNCSMIPKYYALGAVIASDCSMGVMTLINFIFIRKQISYRKLIVFSIKPMCSAIIMGVFVILVSNLFNNNIICTLVQIALGIYIYVLGLLLMKDNVVISYYERILNKIRKK